VPNRNLVYDALVLRAKESPGGDRILSLMTADSGLVDVFVFGGPKSKLRSLASPYAAGRAFVYLDPVKEYRKLSDFEVREHFPGLREDLGKLWAAGLVAELLLKTSGGGGDFAEVLELALACLGGLDRARRPADADLALSLFLWRFVGLIGLGPDPSECARCHARLGPGEAGGPGGAYGPGDARPLASGAVYSPNLSGFLCPRCARAAAENAAPGREVPDGDEPLQLGRPVPVNAGVLRWLARAEGLDFAEALGVGLDAASLAAVKALAFDLARRAAEGPLASFTVGAGLA
jgi:DNA repair protein RecO (recombination protein O)